MTDRRFERSRAAGAQRRPRNARAPTTAARPDRVAAWALALGLFLILVAATTSRGASGGAPAAFPASSQSAPAGGASAPAGAVPAPDGGTAAGRQLGTRTLRAGAAGDDVRTLQRILVARGYGELRATGAFDEGTGRAVRAFQADRGLAADGVVGPRTRPALVRLMGTAHATWYGPGFYGRRTACGKRLRRTTLGVAHRSLPCGTPVTFFHRGRFVTLPVIDRGPYARGVSWDLTSAAARSIRLRQAERLRAVH